jgi:glycosyltransferase involved in cell wall biosynthesis
MDTPFLSFCLIAKNEAEALPRCLASVAPHVDELIVVDTGSTDRTRAIAESFQAKVFSFEWIDDFAAAKNYAIAQAAGQWILMLDADEEWVITDSGWRDGLRPALGHRLLESLMPLAYLIPLRNADEAEGLTPMMTPRLFRADPALQYRGRYHESLCHQGVELAAHQLQPLPGVGIWPRSVLFSRRTV